MCAELQNRRGLLALTQACGVARRAVNGDGRKLHAASSVPSTTTAAAGCVRHPLRPKRRAARLASASDLDAMVEIFSTQIWQNPSRGCGRP
jgi:hypothetical protein